MNDKTKKKEGEQAPPTTKPDTSGKAGDNAAAGVAGHDDAAQDAVLIKSMIDKYMGKTAGDAGQSEEAKKIQAHYQVMGHNEEEAKTLAGKHMMIQKLMKADIPADGKPAPKTDTGATIYHYGWVRSEAQMNLKTAETHKYWEDKQAARIDYSQVDGASLRLFTGDHPAVVKNWLPPAKGIFQADPAYQLSKREKKHRFMLKLENWLGFRFNKKHYQLVR